MEVFTVVGLFLNLAGAVTLAFGLVKSPTQIDKESGTYYGHNPHLQKSMYRDRKAAIWGISIMAMGFISSLVAELSK